VAERGGETAANLLVETAKTRLQRLDDAEGATRDLEAALERWPDHVEAADMLYKILLMLDHGTRLVEKLSQAAESARSTERSGALWLRIAELYADELGNLAGGISVLRRVLRDRPQHVPMLMLLADLYNRNQQWGDAAETYSEVVRMSSSPRRCSTPTTTSRRSSPITSATSRAPAGETGRISSRRRPSVRRWMRCRMPALAPLDLGRRRGDDVVCAAARFRTRRRCLERR
jgi:tetratricopeptide (TPR) repeat protein